MGHDKYVTYTSYLHLDELLTLQGERRPRDDGVPPEHDELLFTIIHQVYELWFKQLLHELDYTRNRLKEDHVPRSLHSMRRIATILKVNVAQLDVLETMRPLDFLNFRRRLQEASGLQSYQFREIEFVLGHKRADVFDRYPEGSLAWDRLTQRYHEPSLWACFLDFIHRRGYEVPGKLLDWPVTEPHPASDTVQESLVRIAHDDPELTSVVERLVDIDEGLQEWRYRHVKMVERTIGRKPGTGGTEGAPYLRETLNKPVFPDLWSFRTRL